MSSYYVIYGSTTDTYGTATSTTYATARADTGSTAAFTSSTVGKVSNSFATPNYTCAQSFFVFDTSAVPAGDGTGFFFIKPSATGGNVNADTLRIREVSSVANKIAGSALSALTLHADPGTFTSGVTNYTAPVLDVAAIPRSATFRVVVHTVGEENGTTPTGINSFDPGLSDNIGTSLDPRLELFISTAFWDLVGIGTPVTATATPLTLTEPAGVADGDLLVACIASRTTATTAVTNTGWTAVGSQNNNNTLTTGSALASGTMLYRIRSGTPDLTFDLPAGISVAIGQIIAYRNNAATTPLDASTAVTTPISTTAVSVTGLTTTQDDDLLVVMLAGGQEATFIGLTNATLPIAAFGGNTTTDPSPVWWYRRAETVTTTGADTSLSIWDAHRMSTGATGNLTATASLGAGHVVIAGAFKIAAAAVGEVTGTGSATLSASATVSGQHVSPVTGTAAATLAASSSASGVEGVAGTASATIALSGAATGAQAASGTAAATLALSAAAAGEFFGEVTGMAAAALVLSAAAAGEFEEPGAATGLVGVWTGSAWVQKPAKVWTGSAWVQKPVKTWNGTSWAA